MVNLRNLTLVSFIGLSSFLSANDVINSTESVDGKTVTVTYEDGSVFAYEVDQSKTVITADTTTYYLKDGGGQIQIDSEFIDTPDPNGANGKLKSLSGEYFFADSGFDADTVIKPKISYNINYALGQIVGDTIRVSTKSRLRIRVLAMDWFPDTNPMPVFCDYKLSNAKTGAIIQSWEKLHYRNHPTKDAPNKVDKNRVLVNRVVEEDTEIDFRAIGWTAKALPSLSSIWSDRAVDNSSWATGVLDWGARYTDGTTDGTIQTLSGYPLDNEMVKIYKTGDLVEDFQDAWNAGGNNVRAILKSYINQNTNRADIGELDFLCLFELNKDPGDFNDVVILVTLSPITEESFVDN